MAADKNYDPFRHHLLDDSDNTYQPQYVSPSHDDDDNREDDEVDSPLLDHGSDGEETLQDNTTYFSAHYTPSTHGEDRVMGSSYIDGDLGVDGHLQDNGQEYFIEPLLDVTTPAYAPSQTLGSPSTYMLAVSECEDPLSPTSTHVETVLMSPTSPILDSPVDLKSEQQVVDTTPPPEFYEDDNHAVPFRARTVPARSRRLNDDDQDDAYFEAQQKEIFGDDYDDQDENRLNDEGFEGFERDEQPESQVDGIIADIFGESDAEEEFEGFAENELEKGVDESVEPQRHASTASVSASPAKHSDGEDEGEDDGQEEFVSDFDKIMERKREEMRRRRRRNKDIEFLNDSDDQIISVISRMKQAAEVDRQLLADNQPATQKLSMLHDVTAMLRRADLKGALVENGMLTAITEWLSPLPGHTLPNLIIRDSMLSCLKEFQSLSTDILRESGIGKALMYLYKHPRETRENKNLTGRLINEWLRPIFNLTSDYRTLTKEERKQLDYEHLPKRRHIESEGYDHRDINRELDGETKGLLRPGDPGWVGRARVPQPSNKDYIVRPKWRVGNDGQAVDDDEDGDGGDDDTRRIALMPTTQRRKTGSSGTSGPSSRIETHIRNLANSARKHSAKTARAVTMSIEGRKVML